MTAVNYPLINLGEEHPAKHATVSIYVSPHDMGRCTRIGILGGCFNQQRQFYDRDGNIYKITNVSPEPELTAWQKFLAHTVYNPSKKYAVTLSPVGQANLDDMKRRIRELLDHDPGDILYQWIDEEEWERGLAAASSVSELFDFVLYSQHLQDVPESDGQM